MDWIKNNAGLFTLGIVLVAVVAYVETRMGNMETRLNARMNRLETDLKEDIREVRIELKADIQAINSKLDQLIFTILKEKPDPSKKGKRASAVSSGAGKQARADQ